MDRQLRPALEKICRKNIELKDDLERKKLLLNEKGQHLASRRILKKIYAHLAANNNMLEVVANRHLSDMKWGDYGDAKAREYYHGWIDRTTRLHCRLDDQHLHDMLLTEMKRVKGLRWI